jgi:hypothetical protein
MSSRSFPRSVLFFGLANTALGALGLASGLQALWRPQQTVAMQIYQQVDLPTQSMQWLQLAMLMSPISFGIMLICGIALLRKKAWGRTLAIYYGMGASLIYLLTSGINIARIADRASNMQVLSVIFGILVTTLLGGIYRLVMVYCLTRPEVKRAFAEQPIGAEILEFKPVRRRSPRQ